MRPIVAALLLAACATAGAKTPPTPAKPAPPTRVEEVDAWRLQAKQMELEKWRAVRDAAKEKLESAEHGIAASEDQVRAILAYFEKKYVIDVSKDHFDQRTLEILRAPAPPATANPVKAEPVKPTPGAK